MSIVERDWKASDGTTLRTKSWLPQEPSKAWVVGLHGLNSCVDDWLPLAEPLNVGGFSLAAWNLRGQGLDPDENRRGAWLDVDGMIADLERFIEELGAGGAPVFLAGDSMGALLAIRAAVDPRLVDRVTGLLLFVPVVALAQRNPPWVKGAMRCLSRNLPSLRMNPSWLVHGRSASPKLTRRKERQEEFEAAPHRIRRQTLGFLADMGDLIESAAPAAAKLTEPVAVFSAGHDAFVTAEAIDAFVRAIRSDDKTHFHYPESYHQLLHDLDAERVANDAVGWIGERLAKIGDQSRWGNDRMGG